MDEATTPVRWRQFYETEAQRSCFRPDRDPLEATRVRLVLRLWPRGVTSALDVGCGDGFLCSEWARRRQAREIFGADLVLERARRAHAAVAGGHFTVQSAGALGFPSRQFDVVSLVETLEHLDAPEAALREAARVSRRYVLITVPYREDVDAARCICPRCLTSFHPAGHLQRFDEARATALFHRAGLRVRRLEIQCYLWTLDHHSLFAWWPAPVKELVQAWARRAQLIQGTFLGVLGERVD